MGTILKALGGLYEVKLNHDQNIDNPLAMQTVSCNARGIFRHEKITPLVGDEVVVNINSDNETNQYTIEKIISRKNELIRPPLSNLDIIYIVIAIENPEPVLTTIDKLISIAEFNKVEPIIIISKSDLNIDKTEILASIYELSGFNVFVSSSEDKNGIDKLLPYILKHSINKISAFVGASGVGKSTLINALFPVMSLETGELSKKIARGKNTTRHVELFPLSTLIDDNNNSVLDLQGYIADTPGFSMLDFVKFDFYNKEDLPYTFREFAPYLGNCKYKKCTHTKEDGCAILEALKNSFISSSRHNSFIKIYNDIKDKKEWDKKI